MYVLSMTLKVNINYLYKRPRITRTCNGEKLCFNVRYELAYLPNFEQAMPMIGGKKFHVKYPNSAWSTIWENIASTPFSRRDACHVARSSCTTSYLHRCVRTAFACRPWLGVSRGTISTRYYTDL
jgi:hypothetical protein